MGKIWHLVAAVLLIAPMSSLASSPTVSLRQGTFMGIATMVAEATPVVKFLGIPYADKAERWMPPQAPAVVQGVQMAIAEPPACIQQFSGSDQSRELTMQVHENPPPASESEDCLMLNLFTRSLNGSRPVMFWLFGGGLALGTAVLPQYDGSSFAANQDVVVVAPNYRTNVFGFPGNISSVPKQNRNLGLLDQRMALQWVQENIAQFGGDPDMVTVFGQSAGASSVDTLVVTMPENPPFRAAIIESGIASKFTRKSVLSSGEDLNDPIMTLATAVNCSNTNDTALLECMKEVPAAQIQQVIEQQSLSFRPVPDGGVTINKNPEDARAQKRVANVPIMMGTTAQEGSIFIVTRNNGSTNIDFSTFLRTLLPNNPVIRQKLLAAYPVGIGKEFTTGFDAATQLATDIGILCELGLEANASAAAGFKTWRYSFNASFPNTAPFPGAGAYHASEIPLVFGNLPINGSKSDPSDTERQLSMTMQKAWADFAKDPYSGPGWAPVGGSTSGLGVLGGPLNATGVFEVAAGSIDARCALYEQLIAASGESASTTSTAQSSGATISTGSRSFSPLGGLVSAAFTLISAL